MKIAIIGTGRVGSTLTFRLVDNKKINKLTLINRTQKNAEGLKADLVATFPNYGNKITVGDFPDANDADIIVITSGSFGAPAGTSLWDVNKPIVEDIFKKINPKKDAKIIIITTPCDKTANLVLKLTGLKYKNIIGFGGQLDVNRLKYLIYSDINDFSKDIDVNFVGEHGKRGIPIFREPVSDRHKIIEETKNYFGLFLSDYNASTYGTANELAKLIEALMSKKKTVLNISYYNQDHEIFITWPCLINENGINKPIKIDLNDEEKKKLDELIKIRKKEEEVL